MAGAPVQTVSSLDDSGASSTTQTCVLATTTTGNLIFIHVCQSGNAVPTTVSDGTNNATLIRSTYDATNDQSSHTYYKENATGKTTPTWTVTWASAVTYRRMQTSEHSGLAISGALDKETGQAQASPGTGADGVTSGAMATTTAANTYLIAAMQTSGTAAPGPTISLGTSYSGLVASNGVIATETRNVTATGAYAGTFQISSNTGTVCHVAAFKLYSTGVTVDITPIAGVLKLLGSIPSSKLASAVVSKVGALLFSGALQSISLKGVAAISPIAGAITLRGNTPSIKLFTKLAPANGKMLFGGHPLSVNQAAGKYYSTTFALTENPISEGGVWNRSNDTTYWGTFQTYGGSAHGTGYSPTPSDYKDNYSFLKGYGFGPVQEVRATIYLDETARYGWTKAHEFELHLHAAEGSGTYRCYEFGMNEAGGAFIVRWNGAPGNWSQIDTYTFDAGILHDGDEMMATIDASGNIKGYKNGVLVASATDTTFTDGEPGMGTFTREDPSGGSMSEFGFKTWSATNGGVAITVETGLVSFSGSLLTVKTAVSVQPKTGNINLAGLVPLEKLTIRATTSAGTLRFIGQTPTVSTATKTEAAITTAPGALAFTGKVATIKTVTKANPTSGAFTFSGAVASEKMSIRATTQTGALRFTGQLMGVTKGAIATISPLAGAVTFAGKVPTISIKARYAVNPQTGALTFMGHAPTLSLKIPFQWSKFSKAASTWTKSAISSSTWTKQ